MDLKRFLVESFQAWDTRAAALAKVLGALDPTEVVVVVLVQPLRQKALEAENAILRRHRPPVVKLGVVSELEGIGAPVRRNLPEPRERGDDIEVLVERRQTVVKLLHQHDVDGEHRLGRVERSNRVDQRIAKDTPLKGNLSQVLSGDSRIGRMILLDQPRREGGQNEQDEQDSGDEPVREPVGSFTAAQRLRVL